MATGNPVSLGNDEAWVIVHDGAADGVFRGTVEQVGGGPVVLRIATSEPTALAGGFAPRYGSMPIVVEANEVLYGRSAFDGVVSLVSEIPNSKDPILSGTFSSVSTSAAFPFYGKGRLRISGGTGTVAIQSSDDGGSTWTTISKNTDGELAVYDITSAAPLNIGIEEDATDILYRLNCTAWTSAIQYRVDK